MSTKLHYLQQVEIFQDLSQQEMQQLDHQALMMQYSAGHLFYAPDDPVERLFVIKQGQVQLYRLTPDGRKIVVAALESGAVFGHMALLGQRLHHTFAEAVTDCLICVFQREDVVQLLLKKPRVALRVLETMGRWLFDLQERLEETTFKRIPARLAGLLLRLNREHGQAGIISGYTHQTLADMLGTYRETTTQTLNEFKQRNLIRTGRKSIEILDERGLETLAEA